MLTARNASEKRKQRKGHWLGILPQGGGLGQRDKERGWDNKISGFSTGSVHGREHGAVAKERM